jgi:hypothetical protein
MPERMSGERSIEKLNDYRPPKAQKNYISIAVRPDPRNANCAVSMSRYGR